MASLSFKQFLSIVQEDAQQDVNKLMADISLIDTQINQRTAPLITRKAQLQKLLALKQKQAQAQQAQDAKTSQDPSGEMQSGTRTTTPGGTGSSTPGGAPSLR
jgi:hypothetical protein